MCNVSSVLLTQAWGDIYIELIITLDIELCEIFKIFVNKG